MEKNTPQIGQAAHAPVQPSSLAKSNSSSIQSGPSTKCLLLKDLLSLSYRELITIVGLMKQAITGGLIDDNLYGIERLIQLVSTRPVTSPIRSVFTGNLLAQLWNDLNHPTLPYTSLQSIYREADGSNNNILFPHIGAAGSPYTRTVKPRLTQPIARPDPGVLFDSLMAREHFQPHPNRLSSMFLALAIIITHDVFQTDRKNHSISHASSYLDLSPLYGSNQEEQNLVRTFNGGRLKPDCFSEKRAYGLPQGVGILLIMFNRFHNHVVQNLALIDENGRFQRPDEGDTKACIKYDNDLFQTGRLITCGLYINCILKDYVRTILNINRIDSDWSPDPRSEDIKALFGETTSLGGGNQVSAEFNLVYRWHSCISEGDAQWIQGLYADIFDGKDPEKISMKEFFHGMENFEASLSDNPQERPFANLERLPDGTFDDDGLVRILANGIEGCAGSFGARGVPKFLRSVEILGINQARSWNLSSLNEFRKHFNLMPHKTFEDINPDPYVADQLKNLYDHPDHVELYPGLVVEKTKEAIVPGSGLCANFTLGRTVLSDAVALVRGDRFYTVDYTPNNLTNWGYNESNFDTKVDNGQVFYKLIIRAFPQHFKSNSVYAHFPLVTPSENEKILSNLKISDKYSWDKPARTPQPIMVNSYAACKKILENKQDFKVTWGDTIEFIMKRNGRTYGRDFMLAGDGPANEASRKLMHHAMYIEDWHGEIKKFYKDITLKLLRSNSYKITGANQVDVVRDIGNLAHVHFCANFFGLPLKTETNPGGVYNDQQLYQIMALVFTCIFFDVDPVKSFPLHETARAVTQQLGEIFMQYVKVIDKSGFSGDLLDKTHPYPALPHYGIHMIRRLLDTKLSLEEIVWTNILPTAGGMVANQAQLFSQCLEYYLSDEGSEHMPEIRRLSLLDTPEADKIIMHYALEGARMRSVVMISRAVASKSVVSRELNMEPGQRVVCNLVSACMDPNMFPNPTKVDLNRDINSYIHLGLGPHKCLGFGMTNVALTTMLKTMSSLENLRRAPGAQGYMKKVPGPGGMTLYMLEDQSSLSPFPSSMKVRWDGELPL